MIDDYTRLLISAAEHDDPAVADHAVHKLIAHLRSMGRLKLLPQIMRELKRIMAHRTALAAKVEVAHKSEAPAALKAAAELGIKAKHAEVNPSLISGWRARKGGVLVDQSGKRALIDIYQKVTA